MVGAVSAAVEVVVVGLVVMVVGLVVMVVTVVVQMYLDRIDIVEAPELAAAGTVVVGSGNSKAPRTSGAFAGEKPTLKPLLWCCPVVSVKVWEIAGGSVKFWT